MRRLLLVGPIEQYAPLAYLPGALQLFGSVLARLPKIGEKNPGALRSKGDCRRRADAMIGSGNQRDLVAQSWIDHSKDRFEHRACRPLAYSVA